MSILVSHTSALQLMRLRGYPARVKEWSESTSYVPPKLPGHQKVMRIISADDLLRELLMPLDLLVRTDNNSHTTALADKHVTRSAFPRDAFVRLSEDLYCVAPELIAFQMARGASVEQVALLLYELVGTYALDCGSSYGMTQRKEPLTTIEAISEMLLRRGSTHGSRKVGAALPLVAPDSGSPMESKLALRIKAPVDQGGWGMQFTSMNHSMWLGRLSGRFEELKLRKPDILFCGVREGSGPRFVALEYHGAWHLQDEQVKKDEVRRNEFAANGIKDYTIFKDQYDDLDYMDWLLSQIGEELGICMDSLAWGKNLREDLYQRLEKARPLGLADDSAVRLSA